jgi:radical SAM superfamily enzyme YgiQ (UPF0313 family)
MGKYFNVWMVLNMKTVAILSPMSDPVASAKRLNIDFTLQLKKTNDELTFETLHHLASNSYNTEMPKKRSNVELDTISAAGYYLTSLLRQNNYNTITTSKIDDDSLTKIANQNPIAFCISTTMILEKESLSVIIKRIREVMKDILIIIGGVFVWKSYLWTREFSNPEENNRISQYIIENAGMIFPCTKLQIDADIFVVSDHGGSILLEVLDEVVKKGSHSDFRNIPNLALPDFSGNFYFTHRVKEEINYEEDYTHWELIDELPPRIPVRTSVGCPYRCGYCDFCYLYPKITFRSPASIKTELMTIKKLLISGTHSKKRIINFSDDNVFNTPKRTDELCNMLIELDMGLPWSGFIRASSINASNIHSVQRSGLNRPWIGVESGDQAQLNRMNKKQKIEVVKRGIELLDNQDISVLMTFLIGYLGENDTSINNTINFLNNIKTTNSIYIVFPLIIFPMSEISMPQVRQKWDVKGISKEWSHKTMDSKTAVEKCKLVFKNVKSVPYGYTQESISFLQKYSPEIRKKLYSLRQEITVAFMEQAPWDNTARLFSEIAATMGVNTTPPTIEFGKEILYPDN